MNMYDGAPANEFLLSYDEGTTDYSELRILFR